MSKEIEIKLFFPSKKKIITLLSPQIKFVKKVKIRDRYYSQEHFNMQNTHSLVRIRECFADKDKKLELTYKGKAKDQENIWKRKELTVPISFPENMRKILLALGLRQIRECVSQREYWRHGKLEFVFSKFTKPATLTFLEIEGESEKQIKEVVQKLGNNVKEVGEEIFDIFDRAAKS